MTDYTHTPRPLPASHEDTTSPYHVPDHLRDEFQRVHVVAKQLTDAERRHADELTRQDDLALWTKEHDRRAAGDPERFRRWKREWTKPDGTPRLSRVGQIDGALVRSRGPRQLTRDEADLAHFRCVLDLAAVTVASARANRRADLTHALRARCPICGVVGDRVPERWLRGSTACEQCQRTGNILRVALAEVPNGGTRAEVLVTWLTQSGVITTDEPLVGASTQGESRWPWRSRRQ